jgi:transcriptional regulator NrdR family protein
MRKREEVKDKKSDGVSSSEKKDEHLKKEPFSKRLKIFCLHPTVWRLAILAVAVVTTIITAGAIIPLITLAATAFTALISVVGKTLQHRSFERAKFQNGLTKVIEKRENDIQQLRQKQPNVFRALEKAGQPFAKANEIHEIKNAKPENRGWSVARVLTFIGLEQFWTISLFSTVANPIGLAVYAGGIVLGTAIVKSEYDYRVKEEQERSRLKQETNERCQMLGIAKYKNDKELYQQFKDRMINYKAVELLCKEDMSKCTDEEITKRFNDIRADVAAKMQFTNIPQEVSFTRNFLNAVNPFKEENAVRTFDIDFDEDKLHFAMRKGYEKIKTPVEQPSKAMSEVKAEELAAATQGLKAGHISSGHEHTRQTVEGASTKFRDAVKKAEIEDGEVVSPSKRTKSESLRK